MTTGKIISLQVLFCLSLHFFLWIFLSKLILFQYTKMNCACMPQIAFFLLQEEKLCKSLNMILRKICQWKYVIWKLPLFLSLFKFDHLLNRVTTNLKKRDKDKFKNWEANLQRNWKAKQSLGNPWGSTSHLLYRAGFLTPPPPPSENLGHSHVSFTVSLTLNKCSN